MFDLPSLFFLPPLKIYHTCGSLQLYYSFQYAAVLPQALQAQASPPDDVDAMFRPWLQLDDSLRTTGELVQALQRESDFVPPGDLAGS